MSFASLTDTRQLATLLQELAEAERRCEIKRQVLSEHRAFNPDDLFGFLARASPRGLTPADLQSFFSDHGLAADLRDLHALVGLFDLDRDGVVDRREFKQAVLSHEQGFSDGVESRLDPPFEVQVSLLKLLDEELGGLKAAEKARAAIRSEGPQHLVALFDALDAGRKGFVDVRDIYELLNKHETGSTYSKASRVLRRLDRDRDNKVTLEEWEASFDPLLFADNVFHVLAPQKKEVSAKKQVGQYSYEKRERNTPASEVSYNITPAHPRSATGYLNTGTLAYSKSPHRKNYSPLPASWTDSAFKSPARRVQPADPDHLQSSTKQARPKPTSDVVYHDVVTVTERSPDRHEKRTYISKKFADGSVEKEERIYEPVQRTASTHEPEFRIERAILERDRSASKRQPASAHKSHLDASSTSTVSRPRHSENPALRERSPLRIARPGLAADLDRLERTVQSHPELPPGFLRAQSPAATGFAQTEHFEREQRFVDPRYTLDYDLHSQQARLSPPRRQASPARHAPVSPPSRLGPRASHTHLLDRSAGPDPGFVEHRYDYADRERVVYSPARDAPRDRVYRREEITAKSPPQPFHSDWPAQQPLLRRDSFGPDPAARDPPLKEEIITHHEVDAPNDRIANTYIRKVYANHYPNPKPQTPIDNPKPQTPNLSSPPRKPATRWPDSPAFSSPASPNLDLPKSYASPSRALSHLMANTAEYVELVRRESDKFKRRDDLASKLAPDLKFSSLSQPEKSELVNCLKTKVGLFREMEKARAELAGHEAFAIAEVFRTCKRDPLSHGLSFEDFRGLFDALSMPTDEKLVRLVFVRNDYDNDGSLSFFEFSELVGPFNPALRQQMNERRETGYFSVADLPQKTRQAFERCLRALVDFERETDSTREVMQHRLYSLFNLIDQSNKNLIVLQDLDEILQAHGFQAAETELIALIRKFDFNMDGKISMVEFINEMSPLRNSKPFETLRNRGY